MIFTCLSWANPSNPICPICPSPNFWVALAVSIPAHTVDCFDCFDWLIDCLLGWLVGWLIAKKSTNLSIYRSIDGFHLFRSPICSHEKNINIKEQPTPPKKKSRTTELLPPCVWSSDSEWEEAKNRHFQLELKSVNHDCWNGTLQAPFQSAPVVSWKPQMLPKCRVYLLTFEMTHVS